MTKMSQLHDTSWVSFGPPSTIGGAGDWVILPDAEEKYQAPGRVVLARRGTHEIHPYAEKYAIQARVLLEHANAYSMSRTNLSSRPRFLPPIRHAARGRALRARHPLPERAGKATKRLLPPERFFYCAARGGIGVAVPVVMG